MNNFNNKDWGGNARTTFASLGASNHCDHDRETHDYYATDPIAIERLAKVFNIPHNIYECSAGEGSLTKKLLELGHNVISTDLIDRGTEGIIGGVDFLKTTKCPKGYSILTNPPYSLAQDFVLHSLDILEEGQYALFFLKIQFLESQGRFENIFSKYPPKYIYVATSRVVCAMNGKFVDDNGKRISSAVCYCWYIWQKGFNGEPIVRWF